MGDEQKEKIKIAVKKIYEVIKELKLTSEEVEIIVNCMHGDVLKQTETRQRGNKAIRYLPAILSALAIAISMISITASLLK